MIFATTVAVNAAAIPQAPPPAFIVVSGQAPVPAQRIYAGDRVWVTVASGTVVMQPQPERRTRCGACNMQGVEDTKWMGIRLGLAMCARCEAEHVADCQSRWGRLPGEGEVYCLGCRSIRNREDLPPADFDGHRRGRCRPCRRAQVSAADARRRQRARKGWDLTGQGTERKA